MSRRDRSSGTRLAAHPVELEVPAVGGGHELPVLRDRGVLRPPRARAVRQ